MAISQWLGWVLPLHRGRKRLAQSRDSGTLEAKAPPELPENPEGSSSRLQALRRSPPWSPDARGPTQQCHRVDVFWLPCNRGATRPPDHARSHSICQPIPNSARGTCSRQRRLPCSVCGRTEARGRSNERPHPNPTHLTTRPARARRPCTSRSAPSSSSRRDPLRAARHPCAPCPLCERIPSCCVRSP